MQADQKYRKFVTYGELIDAAGASEMVSSSVLEVRALVSTILLPAATLAYHRRKESDASPLII